MIILCPLLIYAAVDFVFRVGNGIIAPDLAAEFDLDAATLGLVSGVFFIAFGLSQLPLGLFLDRYGPREVVVCLLAISVVGAILFITSRSVTGLMIGRLLIGIGMSGSLVAGLKTASLWMPDRVPGATLSLIGMTGVGGMLASGPFAELLHHVPWRTAMTGLAITTSLLCALTFVLVPSTRDTETQPLAALIGTYREIFSSLRFWRLAPIAISGVGVGAAYQTLWAPLWLRDVTGLDADTGAWTLFAMLAGLATGSFSFGALSRVFERREIAPSTPVLFSMTALIACQILLLTGIATISVALWIAASVLLAGAFAAFPIVVRRFPSSYAARVGTALVFCVFISGFVIQWSVGLIIGMFPASADDTYLPLAHQTGLGFCIALQALALAWYAIAGRLSRSAE